MIRALIFILLCGMLAGCSATSNRYVRKSETNETSSGTRYSGQDSSTGDNQTGSLDAEIYAEEENDEELEPAPENEAIDLSVVMSRFDSKTENVSIEHSTVREKTLMEIIKYLNTPYKYGGNSMDGIDCSAFTQVIYQNVISVSLLRSAREQYTQGEAVDKNELQFGDLVFFNTRKKVRPGHVGIYIGDNLFAHASSKHGVIVTSLDHDYYTRTYMGARRIEPAAF